VRAGLVTKSIELYGFLDSKRTLEVGKQSGFVQGTRGVGEGVPEKILYSCWYETGGRSSNGLSYFSFCKDAMSMTKRYFTSLRSILS